MVDKGERKMKLKVPMLTAVYAKKHKIDYRTAEKQVLDKIHWKTDGSKGRITWVDIDEECIGINDPYPEYDKLSDKLKKEYKEATTPKNCEYYVDSNGIIRYSEPYFPSTYSTADSYSSGGASSYDASPSYAYDSSSSSDSDNANSDNDRFYGKDGTVYRKNHILGADVIKGDNGKTFIGGAGGIYYSDGNTYIVNHDDPWFGTTITNADTGEEYRVDEGTVGGSTVKKI